MQLELVIFGANDDAIRESISSDLRLSNVCVVRENGPEVARKYGVDAFLVTLMQAERFGARLPFAEGRAQVLKMPREYLDRGLPRYFIASVAVALQDPRDWKAELAAFLGAAKTAVEEHNLRDADQIVKIGVLIDNLLTDRLSPHEIVTIVGETFARR